MNYELIKSSHFTRKASKILKLNPDLTPQFRQLLVNLTNDPFMPKLRTHGLKGKLSGSYSCSLSYEYRIIFKIINDCQTETSTTNIVFLETIGTHDEVY